MGKKFKLRKSQRDLLITLFLIFASDVFIFIMMIYLAPFYSSDQLTIINLVLLISVDLGIFLGLMVLYGVRSKRKDQMRQTVKRKSGK